MPTFVIIVRLCQCSKDFNKKNSYNTEAHWALFTSPFVFKNYGSRML